MILTKPEKKELRAIKHFETFRNDNLPISVNRHNPYIINGKFDCDGMIEFLSDYNNFLSHPMKQAKPFIERNIKL